MLQTAVELALAPMLVGASGIVARRWGQHAGGVISAFPAIVGPVLLIAALDHGTRFAARAADGTLLGLVALSAFALSYARMATRARWRASVLVAWAAAAVSASVAGLLVGGAGPPAGLLLAGVSLSAAHRLLGGRRTRHAQADSSLDPGSLPLRMLATAGLVAALATSANAFGAVAGGMLAALPVLASVLAVATHRRHGAAAVVLLFEGMLAGMVGFITFCEVLVLILASSAPALAFGVAGASALAVQAATLVLVARFPARRPGALSAAMSAGR